MSADPCAADRTAGSPPTGSPWASSHAGGSEEWRSLSFASSSALASVFPADDDTAFVFTDPRGTTPVEVDLATREGVEAAEAGVRALDNDAAVGLVNLSVALLLEATCLTGGGTGW